MSRPKRAAWRSFASASSIRMGRRSDSAASYLSLRESLAEDEINSRRRPLKMAIKAKG